MEKKTVTEKNEQDCEFQNALHNCKRAIEFYDKVINASSDERFAAGKDHIQWIVAACRVAASFAAKQEPQ